MMLRISTPLLVGFVLAAGGCQSYEPRPLDLPGTREAWLARSAGDETTREFAERLSDAEGNDAPFDPSDGLTLAEAEPVTLVFNRELRQARLEVNVTRATAEFAGLWEDPVAGVDIERIVSGVSDPWVLAGTVGLTIPISGRLDVEKVRAGASLSAELQRLAAMEWAKRSALRQLWIEWSAQSHRLRLTTDLTGRLRDLVDLSRLQEKAGVLTRIDARLFRVELAANEARFIGTRAKLAELELQLRDIIGLAPDAPIAFVESVRFAARGTDTVWLREMMESDNAELAAVRMEYEVAEQSLRLEVRKQYPDLTIGPGFGTDQGDERVLLGLRLPIPLWNRNQQGVAQATAGREVARGRFKNTFERLSFSLALAKTRYDAGRAVREAVESRVAPLADEQEADVMRVAELGGVDPLLILQTVRAQYDAKIQLVDAMAAESIGAIWLDELIGPPTRSEEPSAPKEGNTEQRLSSETGDSR
jgi:outer membrane protein TolC